MYVKEVIILVVGTGAVLLIPAVLWSSAIAKRAKRNG